MKDIYNIYHSQVERQFSQKIYKLSKTNVFFSHFKGTRGEQKPKYFAPKKAVGEMIPVFLATNMVIPVSKKGTEKSMTD